MFAVKNFRVRLNRVWVRVRVRAKVFHSIYAKAFNVHAYIRVKILPY